MSYVLVIVSLVAMGGPKADTVTFDHIPNFTSEAACKAAGGELILTLREQKYQGKVQFRCLQQS